MSETILDEATTLGYEAPRNVQFSVFLDNRVGKLLELLEVFQGQATTLAGLTVIDSVDHAVVRVVTSRSELTRRLLSRKGMAFSETEVLIVEITPEKSMAMMCKALLSAELSIHYAYPLMVRPHGAACVAIHCDDEQMSGAILRRKGFTLLAENDLGENLNPGTTGKPNQN